MTTPRFFATLLLALIVPSLALAVGPAPEPAGPPPPAKYDVVVRYDIDAYRNERIVQWREMLEYYRALGFEKGEGPEDEAENRAVARMSGTIASAQARKLLLERHARAVRLVPAGSPLPKDETPVRVQLELAGVLPPEPGRYLYSLDAVRRLEREDGPALARQQLLADQVRSVLVKLGFREAAGYDTRGHTRLLGTVPANRLDALLDDLRRQPAGAELPAPFASRWPLRVIEVRPDLPLPVATPAPAPIPKGQETLTPDLRAALAGEGADRPQRLEVILTATPVDPDTTWQAELRRAVPDLVIEGRLGPVVSVLAPLNQAPALAAVPGVSTVRLPRSAQPQLFGARGEKGPEVLGRGSALAALAGLGRGGKSVTVAVIDGDFRGWQGLLGQGLPRSTRLLDLTATRNTAVQAEPYPGDATTLGHGTHLALAVARAAPEAELVLVRIDPAAPYQLLTVARALAGDALRSINLDRRADELQNDRERLGNRRVQLLEERRAAYEARGEADEVEKALKTYRENQQKLEQQERDYDARLARYLRLEEGLRGLKRVKTVVCGLAWNEGWPVDGSGPLAQYLQERRGRSATWLLAAGDIRGQVWAGPYRDSGGDGRLLFQPADRPLPEGLWGPNVAFLSWEPTGGKAAVELPAGARLRIAVQWREAHDPEFLRRGEDLYREPLAPLQIDVLRQLDSKGTKQPADDFEVVAQSSGLPQRIDNQANAATYEQTVDFVVKQPGRYALQLRGRRPNGTRPASVPTLPGQVEQWDLRARLFIDTLAGPGRAIYRDYATAEGSLGTPADARPTTRLGMLAGDAVPVFNVELLRK